MLMLRMGVSRLCLRYGEVTTSVALRILKTLPVLGNVCFPKMTLDYLCCFWVLASRRHPRIRGFAFSDFRRGVPLSVLTLIDL